MNVRYRIGDKLYPFTINNKDMTQSFLLTNPKGDFLHKGIEQNTSKFQGFSYRDTESGDIFKIIDDFFLENTQLSSITIKQHYEVEREYTSNDDNPLDTTYLGPTGGIYHTIEDFSGTFTLDLDIRKHDDYNPWGRNHRVYKKGSVIFVEYTKQEEYTIFFGISLPTENYKLVEEWVEKEYEYCKSRNSLSNWHVFRLLQLQITENTHLLMAAGKTEKEVEEQLTLLKDHVTELKGFDRVFADDLIKQEVFETPVSNNAKIAYDISLIGLYSFLIKRDDESKFSYAGYPWFHQEWTRDELVALRAFIDRDEDHFVLSKLLEYINQIDEQSGELPRLSIENSLKSCDGVLWLAKRVEDFIFHLDEQGKLRDTISNAELNKMYNSLTKAFSHIITNQWDVEKELLKVKQGDSWMDTLTIEYPMDIQVQLLGFVSTLGVLSGILDKKEDQQHYLDLEFLLKEKIRQTFFKKSKLHTQENESFYTANVFLAYYFYPDLLTQKEWEGVFDKALSEMKLSWGGIASLSKEDDQFQDTYTGEDNISYHRGDSWYWINNIAGIVLNHCNERKYRKDIHSLLKSSTEDILQQGTFGFSSEVSSAKQQQARGCTAQLWSTTTYLELIKHVFDKERL